MKLPCSFRKLSEEFKTHKEDCDDHGEAWVVCLGIFFLPLVLYQIFGLDQLLDRPVAFDVGIVTVSAAFGGLLLNAGVSTYIPNKKETIRVAKKFIYVVVLTVISLPVMHFVEFIGGVDVNSFEFDSLEAWFRGLYFWIAAISFYLAIGLFIIALVDLVYLLMSMGSTEHGCKGIDSTSCPKDSSDSS